MATFDEKKEQETSEQNTTENVEFDETTETPYADDMEVVFNETGTEVNAEDVPTEEQSNFSDLEGITWSPTFGWVGITDENREIWEEFAKEDINVHPERYKDFELDLNEMDSEDKKTSKEKDGEDKNKKGKEEQEEKKKEEKQKEKENKPKLGSRIKEGAKKIPAVIGGLLVGIFSLVRQLVRSLIFGPSYAMRTEYEMADKADTMRKNEEREKRNQEVEDREKNKDSQKKEDQEKSNQEKETEKEPEKIDKDNQEPVPLSDSEIDAEIAAQEAEEQQRAEDAEAYAAMQEEEAKKLSENTEEPIKTESEPKKDEPEKPEPEKPEPEKDDKKEVKTEKTEPETVEKENKPEEKKESPTSEKENKTEEKKESPISEKEKPESQEKTKNLEGFSVEKMSSKDISNLLHNKKVQSAIKSIERNLGIQLKQTDDFSKLTISKGDKSQEIDMRSFLKGDATELAIACKDLGIEKKGFENDCDSKHILIATCICAQVTKISRSEGLFKISETGEHQASKHKDFAYCNVNTNNGKPFSFAISPKGYNNLVFKVGKQQVQIGKDEDLTNTNEKTLLNQKGQPKTQENPFKTVREQMVKQENSFVKGNPSGILECAKNELHKEINTTEKVLDSIKDKDFQRACKFALKLCENKDRNMDVDSLRENLEKTMESTPLLKGWTVDSFIDVISNNEMSLEETIKGIENGTLEPSVTEEQSAEEESYTPNPEQEENQEETEEEPDEPKVEAPYYDEEEMGI